MKPRIVIGLGFGDEGNGVKPDTISYYARPAYQRKGSGNNRLLLVRIDEEG